MPLTEKQAAFVASELVRRIGSRRAVKAAAASALEKIALTANPGKLRQFGRFLLGRKPAAVPKGIETMENVFTPSKVDRARSAVATGLDRLGAGGLARRVAPDAVMPHPEGVGFGTSTVRTADDTYRRLKGAYPELFARKPTRGGFWDSFLGRDVRNFERLHRIDPRMSLRALDKGKAGIREMQQSIANRARFFRGGYVDREARDAIREFGRKGGRYDQMLINGSVPGNGVRPDINFSGFEGVARREAINREYYRLYKKMLNARAAVGGGVGLAGAIAYANRSANDYSRSAQEAQIPIDERGNYVTQTSDEYNQPYNDVNSVLEWMSALNNSPSAGTSEADTSRGYNIR